MCAEGLSSIIRRNEDASLLHRCTIARGAPTISHLLFADYCYFFFKASGAEASVMKRILNRYENISGQRINYAKSGVTLSPNTNEESRLEVCTHLGVSDQQNPSNYLGMPMLVGRKKNETFSFLVERVQQKLNGWQNQPISKAGKVVLLKIVAQVIPNFWMNMFLIPMEICDGIEKAMNAFWWGNGSANKGIKWMSWERLCTVKEDGGMGFKKLHEFNVAMLEKQAWRLVNNINPLVTQLMHARYFPKTDFLNASIGANPSYVWRSILESQDVVRKGCRRRIEILSDRFQSQAGEGKTLGSGNRMTNANLLCLSTAHALAMKRVNLPTVCSWCLRNVKEDIHVLFQCCFTREVWEDSRLSSLVTTRPNDTAWTVLQRIFQAGGNEQIMMVGVGCVIRDEWGNLLRAGSNVVQGSYHPREAEAISLKEALTWTKDWKRSKCVFECDAKLLVDAVNGSRGNTYFHAIVEDCTDLLKYFDEVLVLFTHRFANMVAHCLARVSCSMSGPTEWLYTAPDFIICMLDSDK
ncbi:uncharacterized protein LOC141696263 [Apium graveolens]|uniref:uncharacterized protein LOC141696263 n=1 Tax=Apium graveolens TaxID=4045 RepID=UPI003D7A69C2